MSKMNRISKKVGGYKADKNKALSTSIKKDFSEDVKAMKEEVSIGDILTYPELCKYFNLSTATGVQKINQLNEMQRYIEFEKNGRSYIITDFYNIPLPKVRKNTQYSHYIQYILLNYFRTSGWKEFIFTKKQWYFILGFINSKYIDLYKDYDKLLDKVNFGNTKILVKAKNLEAYFSLVDEVFRNMFKNALESLKNKKLINYYNVYYITNPKTKAKRIATPQEESEIIDLKEDILKNEFHAESEALLFYKRDKDGNKLFNAYFDRTDKEYMKRYDMTFYPAVAIQIINAEPSFIQAMEYIESKIDDIKTYRDQLNSISLDKIILKTEAKYNGKLKEAAETILLINNPQGGERQKIIDQYFFEEVQKSITPILNNKLVKLFENDTWRIK